MGEDLVALHPLTRGGKRLGCGPSVSFLSLLLRGHGSPWGALWVSQYSSVAPRPGGILFNLPHC